MAHTDAVSETPEATVEPRRRGRRIELFIAVGVAAAVVIGFVLVALLHNPHGTIDSTRLERQIHTWAVKESPDVASIKVQCPGGIAIHAGDTFHCILSGGGQSERLTVTIENNKGYVTWVVG